MSNPLIIRSPICNFLCDPPDPNDLESIVCNEICEKYKNCALTPNVTFTFINGIYQDRDLFVTGVSNIVASNIKSLSFRLAFYQQLPWFISYILLIIVLIFANIISLFTGILLIVIALVITLLFLYFSATETENIVTQTGNQINSQLQTDLRNARRQLGRDIAGELLVTIGQSEVPCPSLNR